MPSGRADAIGDALDLQGESGWMVDVKWLPHASIQAFPAEYYSVAAWSILFT